MNDDIKRSILQDTDSNYAIAYSKLMEVAIQTAKAKGYTIDESTTNDLEKSVSHIILYFFSTCSEINPFASKTIDVTHVELLSTMLNNLFTLKEREPDKSFCELAENYFIIMFQRSKDRGDLQIRTSDNTDEIIISILYWFRWRTVEKNHIEDTDRCNYIANLKHFLNVPNSSISNLILETLGSGANIGDLPDRKRQINHTTTLKVTENGKRRQISLTSQKAQVTIEIADIDKITGSNKSIKKLFVFALINANEQAIHYGQLTKNYISFPLQDLIDIGFYSTPQSARKGFNAGMDALTSLKIKGHIQKSKKNGSTIDTLEVLFTGARIERGQCTIFLNERINWSFIAQYFTILPRYYFKLPNRASDLLYYIFYLARQHTHEIEERGYFTIGFRAIQHRLQLPSEDSTKNLQRDIKDPIDEAIEQIETEHGKTYGNTEFSLLPVYDESATISEYLENGYLKVGLSGAFAKTFIAISKDTAKQIDAAKKQQARIMEKAVAINTAKKLEANEKTKTEKGNGTK